MQACSGLSGDSLRQAHRGHGVLSGRATSFREHERRILLAQPGIGPTVIARIEATGIHSIEALRLAGVHFVVEMVCLGLGTAAWSNRRNALGRALERLASSADLDVPKLRT